MYRSLPIGAAPADEALRSLEQNYADQDGANLSSINVEPMLEPAPRRTTFRSVGMKIVSPKL